MRAAANPQAGSAHVPATGATLRRVATGATARPVPAGFAVGQRVRIGDQVRGAFAGKTGTVQQLNDGEIGVYVPELGLAWFLAGELQ